MIRRSPGRGHAGERGAGYRRGLRFAGRCQGSVLLSDAAPYCAQAWSITPYFCQTLPEGMLPFLCVFEPQKTFPWLYRKSRPVEGSLIMPGRGSQVTPVSQEQQ